MFYIECVLYRKVHANQTVHMQILSNRDLAAALERNAEDVDAAWIDLCERGAVHGIRACMYLCMYLYVYRYMHACVHIYMYTYILTYIHTYIHTCVHACMHTYIHTFTHTLHTCM